MTNLILKASDAYIGGSLDHINIVKWCLNTITILSNILAEFTSKRKHNLIQTFLPSVDQNQLP